MKFILYQKTIKFQTIICFLAMKFILYQKTIEFQTIILLLIRTTFKWKKKYSIIRLSIYVNAYYLSEYLCLIFCCRCKFRISVSYWLFCQWVMQPSCFGRFCEGLWFCMFRCFKGPIAFTSAHLLAVIMYA